MTDITASRLVQELADLGLDDFAIAEALELYYATEAELDYH